MNDEILVGVFIAYLNPRNGIDNVYYIMTQEDATKFCTHESTKSHNWAFHWTYLINFTNDDGKLIKKYFKKKDNGRYKELIEELDIDIINYEDVKDIIFS